MDEGPLSAGGYDANAITPSKPDIRTLYILLLLSLLSASPSLSSSSSSSSYKLSLLSLEPSPYTALLRGLSADPAWLLRRTLRVYHQSLLSDNKVPRKTKIAVMGQTSALEALLTCYARTEEKVDLRTGLPITSSEAVEGREEVGISVAQVVHHFLLALCTHPGFGIAFEGKGWYPRGWSGFGDALQTGDADQEGPEVDGEEEDAEHAYGNSGGYKRRKRTSLHNPVLYNFLRTISPTRSSLHSELVIKIVQACPELLGAWLPDNSTPANAVAQGDPRGASTAWIANVALVASLLRADLPFDTSSPKASTSSSVTEASGSNTIKPEPPPVSCTISNVIPSPPLTKSIFNRAILSSKDRLLQHQALLLLASALDRIARFARVCEHANEMFEEDAMESKSALDGEWATAGSLLDEEDLEKIAPHQSGSSSNDGQQSTQGRHAAKKRRSTPRTARVRGRWTDTWSAVKREGIRLLPDLSSLVTYIHDLQQRPKSSSEIILIEAASRCVWLYHEALLCAHPINAETSSLADSVRVDVGKLLQSPLLLARPSSLAGETESDAAAPELEAIQTLYQLHTLRTVSAACASDVASNIASPLSFPSTSAVAFNIFSRFTTLDEDGQKETRSHFEVVIKLWLRASRDSSRSDAGSQGLRSACEDLLQTSFGKSSLFELNPNEWHVWMWALCPSEDGSTSLAAPTESSQMSGLRAVLNLIDQCAQRCAKTLHRYMEASRALEQIPSSGESSKTPEFSFSGDIPVSPLFMTILEQFAIRVEKGLFDRSSLDAIAPFMSRLIFSFTAFGLRKEIVQSFVKTCQDAFGKAIDAQSSAEGSTSAPFLQMLKALHWTFDKVLPGMLESFALFEGNRTNGRISASQGLADDPFEECNSVQSLREKFQQASRPLHARALNSFIQKANELFGVDMLFELSPQLERSDGRNPPNAVLDLLQGSLAGVARSHRTRSNVRAFFLAAALHRVGTANKSREATGALLSALISSGNLILAEEIIRQLHADADTWLFLARLLNKNLVEESKTQPIDAGAKFIRSLINDFSAATKDQATDGIWLKAIHELLPLAHPSQLRELGKAITSRRSCLRLEQSRVVLQEIASADDDGEACDEIIRKTKELLESNSGLNLPVLAASIPKCHDAWTVSIDLPTLFDLERQWSQPGGDAFISCLVERSSAFAAGLAGILNKATAAQLRAFPETMHSLITRSSKAVMSTAIKNAAIEHLFIPYLWEQDERLQLLGLRSCSVALACGWEQPDTYAAFIKDHMPTSNNNCFRAGLLNFAATLLHVDPSRAPSQLAKCLIEHTLLWLVRRFAEDAEDTVVLVRTIQAATALLVACSAAGVEVKAHLSEPVIEAGIRNRLSDKAQMDFVATLCCSTKLTSSSATRLGALLASHKHLQAAASESDSVTQCVSTFVFAGAQSNILEQCLVDLYGGTLSANDRTLFAALEHLAQTRELNIWSLWRAGGAESSVLAKLLSLDPSVVFETCAAFPRSRRFCNRAIGDSASVGDAPKRYDPLMVLSALSSALLERKLTGLEWLAVLRTNVLGVIACCMSSRSSHVRAAAIIVLGRSYASIKRADFSEQEQVVLVLDLLRDAVGSAEEHEDGQETPVLPFSTTLFFAHVFRAIAAPANFTFPSFMRFLLQRPRYDAFDLPLLYNFLASSSDDYRQERIWILRYLCDVLRSGGHFEWQICRKRHVPDLLMSLHSSLHTQVGTTQARALIEEAFEIMCSQPKPTKDLLGRHGLLTWVRLQQTNESEPRQFWLRIAMLAIQHDDSRGAIFCARVTSFLLILHHGLSHKRPIEDEQLVKGLVLALKQLVKRIDEEELSQATLGISSEHIVEIISVLASHARQSRSTFADLLEAISTARKPWPTAEEQLLTIASRERVPL